MTDKKLPAVATDYKKPAPKPQPKPVAQAAPVAQAPQGNVEQIVRQAARKYGIDENYFVQIAKCESSLNPNAINYSYAEIPGHHPAGVFQHLTNYWPARAAKYGYEGASVFNAEANANVTAGMWRDGARGLWEC